LNTWKLVGERKVRGQIWGLFCFYRMLKDALFQVVIGKKKKKNGVMRGGDEKQDMDSMI